MTGTQTGYMNLNFPVSSGSMDFSNIVGISFYAKGSGIMRLNLETSDMAAAENYDYFGELFTVSNDWSRYVIMTNAANLTQAGFDAAATFDPTLVQAITFSYWGGDDNVDFTIDNVTLLREP